MDNIEKWSFLHYLDELNVIVLGSKFSKDLVHLDAGGCPSSPKVEGIDSARGGLEDSG